MSLLEVNQPAFLDEKQSCWMMVLEETPAGMHLFAICPTASYCPATQCTSSRPHRYVAVSKCLMIPGNCMQQDPTESRKKTTSGHELCIKSSLGVQDNIQQHKGDVEVISFPIFQVQLPNQPHCHKCIQPSFSAEKIRGHGSLSSPTVCQLLARLVHHSVCLSLGLVVVFDAAACDDNL